MSPQDNNSKSVSVRTKILGFERVVKQWPYFVT